MSVAPSPTAKSDPILVNESSTPDGVESQIGPLVAALGGVIVTFGAMSPQKWSAIAGLLPIVLTMAWRWYRSQQTHALKVTLADAAPNDVARVVRK